MSSGSVILVEIRTVAAKQKKTLAPLTDDHALLDSGLDSLCSAIPVSCLEDLTGCDSFTSSVPGPRHPRTIGDFVALYDQALA